MARKSGGNTKPDAAYTDSQIQAAQAEEKPYRLKTKERGLFLEVCRGAALKDSEGKPITDKEGKPLFSNRKWWAMRYTYEGKRGQASLGVYPDVGLAAAVRAARGFREKLAAGINPIEEKRIEKQEQEAKEQRIALTFQAVGLEYFDKKTTQLSPRYRKQYKQRLEMLFSSIGQVPITDLKRQDLLQILRDFESKGHVETAHRIGLIVGQVFRYGVNCGYLEYSVAEKLGEALEKVEHEHRAAILDPNEIGLMLQAIDDYEGSISIKFAMQMMPYVFVRSIELRGSRWEEFNFDDCLWLIPASRMKRRREHLVPLSRQVVDLLKEIRKFNNSEYVFPSSHSNTATISDMGLLNCLRRLGYDKGQMDVHGFRSIASTFLNELGFRSDVIEMQLSHSQKNAVREAYKRAQYLDERKEMMQFWADYLDKLKEDAKQIKN